MSKSPLYAHILLDRSGSMENCRDTTIDAFNEYVMSLRRSDAVDARLSLTVFDSGSIDRLQHVTAAREFMELSRQNYVPRGGTPLLDAIGQVAADVDQVTLRPGERVSLVILTDGMENASREHTKSSIRALLTDRQDNQGWLITFLGADVDAFAEAGAIGVRSGNYLSLTKGRLRNAMCIAAASQTRFAQALDLATAAFTDDERSEANKD